MTVTSRLPTLWRLGRWLGPWTPATVSPTDVTCEELSFPLGDTDMRAWVLKPAKRSPTGSLFVLPGLHFSGPEDPRMLRFLSALASAGIEVFAPFLPTPMSLSLGEEAVEEAATALEYALTRPGASRPGVFTISFGSILGARLAVDPRFRDRIGDLMFFGGFSDWREVLRFSLTDRDTSGEPVPPDPLNQVAIYINLVDHMPTAPPDTRALRAGWHQFARETWGDKAMKERSRYVPVARRLAEALPEQERALFLRGCAVETGCQAEVDQALTQCEERLGWLDPRPHLAQLRGTVHVAHGADDDVIPVAHADELISACTQAAKVHRWVTGVYGHTEQSGLADLLRQGPTALREVRTMVGLLRAIVAVAHPAARRRP